MLSPLWLPALPRACTCACVRACVGLRTCGLQIAMSLRRSTKASAGISFDFICLVVIAAILAAIGLHENSSVVVVSSMLISPMMNPVLGAVLGTVTRSKALLLTGVCLCVCVCYGCTVCTSALHALSDWTLGAAACPSEKLAMTVRRHTKVLADGEG